MEEFILRRGTEMTIDILEKFIEKHKTDRLPRYEKLREKYESDHDILHGEAKESYKPDNRLVVNYAKLIVDTLNGFFIGVPIKIEHEDKEVSNFLEFVDAYNNIDDVNAEISKDCSIYGHCFELNFTDEEANPGVVKLSPEQAFIIYDESIRKRPLYGVRYYLNTENKLEGSFSDEYYITYFKETAKGIILEDIVEHHFGEVPISEYVENEEKQGAFESVESLIDANNKAISEKANDVDYFADAYLAVIGAELDAQDVKTIRDNRIINIYDSEGKIVDVKFLEKPNADDTQEHLLDRLERLIFQVSMVVNTSDSELGGNVSGISLKYKLQSMYNLAKTKERKFTAALNRRYKMISNLPTTDMKDDDWVKIKYHFTRNLPTNLAEESENAKNLSGIVSKKTQLKALSIVDDAESEIDQINKENRKEISDTNRDGFLDE